jgi:uncharacterized membrane protein YeiH
MIQSQIDLLFFVVDFMAVFVGALGGAIDAVRETRYRYDIIGVLGLAFVSALGGGIARDVVLQHGPPLAFIDIRYELTAFLGAFLGLALRRWEMKPAAEKALLIIDAAGIGLYSVAGTTRALNAGLHSLPAVLLGVTTAVGGGSLRDIVSGRAPKVFERGQFYAIAAFLGSGVFLACDHLGTSRSFSTVAGGLACFALRMLALRLDWHTRPVRS